MKELELKHLAPHLPYKLKCKYPKESIIWECDPLAYETDFYDNKLPLFHLLDYSSCKPILHPLPDLTKPIKVEGYNDGKEFVPIDILLPESDYIGIEYMRDEHIHDFINKNNRLDLCYPFSFWQKLYQWHFDLEGLIRSGLAIDINTL